MRIVVAAIVGGIIVSIWNLVGPTLLPENGTSQLKNLPHFLDNVREAAPKAGMYFFYPEEEMKQKVKELWPWEGVFHDFQPAGFLLVEGKRGGCLGVLASSLLSYIGAAGVVAFILSLISGSLIRRASIGALFGFFGVLSLMVDYGFPPAYLASVTIIQVVGWFVAGLAIAKIVKQPFGAVAPSS